MRRLLALLLCLAAAACGQSDPDELTVWAFGREGEVLAELLPAFEADHPGVTVRVQQIPFSVGHEKLLTGFAGDATPDLAQLGNSWLPEFAALGALEPLGARVARSPIVQKQDYFDGIWDSNVVDGRLYGVPWYVDTRLLFYRRDLLAQAGFDHPPRDWAEWSAAMRAIKREVGPDRYAILLPLNEYEPLVSLALQQPEGMLRNGGRYGNFRGAGFKRALTYYLRQFREGLAPPATSNQIANLWDEFDRGYFSFYITGPWQIGEFKRRLPADRQDTWATAPLPGPTGPGASNAGGSSLVIFRRSEKKPLAWALIEYLSRPEVQVRFHDLTGDLPPRRSVWSASGLRDDPYAAAFADQLTRVEPAPKVPEWERIATEIRLVGEQAVVRGLTVDQAAAELDRRADAILAKRRSLLDADTGQ